jgi:hypothetical protein
MVRAVLVQDVGSAGLPYKRREQATRCDRLRASRMSFGRACSPGPLGTVLFQPRSVGFCAKNSTQIRRAVCSASPLHACAHSLAFTAHDRPHVDLLTLGTAGAA